MSTALKYPPYVVQRDLVVSGDVESDGVLVVKGQVHGNIAGAGIGVGRSGQVVGDIVGHVVVVEGTLSGNIDGGDVFIGAHGVVDGTVFYSTLSIAHGAQTDTADFVKRSAG